MSFQARAFADSMGRMVMAQSTPAPAEGEEAAAAGPYEGDTLAVFFPDTGSAVWVEQDWRAGQPDSKVPPSVRCASFPNEGLLPTDKVGAGGRKVTAIKGLLDLPRLTSRPGLVLAWLVAPRPS